MFESSEAEAEPVTQPGERPSKRRCFWEYRRARETASKKKLGGDVHWSLSWSSSTLPSTLYRREGELKKNEHRRYTKVWISQSRCPHPAGVCPQCSWSDPFLCFYDTNLIMALGHVAYIWVSCLILIPPSCELRVVVDRDVRQ